MDSSEKIPSPIIGLLGEIMSETHTHAEIDRLFAYADAPDEKPEGNKVQKTVDWLRLTNKRSRKPLSVLGALLEDFLERDPSARSYFQDEAWSKTLVQNQTKIRTALTKAGLSYRAGGHIDSASASPVTSLQETVAKGGLKAIGIEMDRALKMVNDDPNAAVHYAGNILEASLKAYLQNKSIPFKDETATLSDLWPLVRSDIGLNPKDLENRDLKKIASGLNSIVDGTMYLRNKKSGAHGRTEEQTKEIALRPRHARLVVHSAHTLSMYVLECLAG
ncbi:Abortive infection C-terminus [Roseovarius lutimaris]|uniref:Abortive infection C-terminus n=1 Tax=Roseovarius lutimaris TaxID=1005928 RepID=A0A1I5DTB9_9RHOB|nr:abortive infection family protein [Roseovarius lutimaris]SFO02438.1 Abortive infection C-terminus [Roseovarius lutimaris]